MGKEDYKKIIERVAAEHGIALSNDDPILIIHTLNKILFEENSTRHQELLDNFHSTLQEILSQTPGNKTNTNLRGLHSNNTLGSQATIQLIEQTIKSELGDPIKKLAVLVKKSHQTAMINIVASTMFLISVLVMLLLF